MAKADQCAVLYTQKATATEKKTSGKVQTIPSVL